MWFALLLACRHVEPAPPDVDELVRFYWTDFEGEDAAMAQAVADTHLAIDGGTISERGDGTLTDLTAEDLVVVGMEGSVDPGLAAGVYLTNVVACDLDALERILYHLPQDELYTGEYDTYSRAYTTDFDAYAAREAATLSWEVDLGRQILGTALTEHLIGGIRRVPDTDFGPAIVARAWLPEPAVFEGDNKTFDQDYQIELFYERAPGEVVHVYGLWRQVDLGSGLDQDSNLVAGPLLSAMAAWDDRTEELCAEGLP